MGYETELPGAPDPPDSPRQSGAPWDVNGLPGPRQVEQIIARETARADRDGEPFSLVLFRAQPGPGAAIAARRLARTLVSRARLADEVGWFSDDALCAVLPRTAAAGARAFADHVCALLPRRRPRPLSVIYTYPCAWFGAESRHPVPTPAEIAARAVGRFAVVPAPPSTAAAADRPPHDRLIALLSGAYAAPQARRVRRAPAPRARWGRTLRVARAWMGAVSGRVRQARHGHAMTFADWVRADLAFVRRRALWHDLAALARAVPGVIRLRRGRGAYRIPVAARTG